MALHPDFVLATRAINRLATVGALEQLGVAVYVTDPRTVEQVIASTERLGRVLGAGEQAAASRRDPARSPGATQRASFRREPRSVFFIVWLDPLISVGRNTFLADALRLAGARSVVATPQDWPNINLEEVVRAAAGVSDFFERRSRAGSAPDRGTPRPAGMARPGSAAPKPNHHAQRSLQPSCAAPDGRHRATRTRAPSRAFCLRTPDHASLRDAIFSYLLGCATRGSPLTMRPVTLPASCASASCFPWCWLRGPAGVASRGGALFAGRTGPKSLVAGQRPSRKALHRFPADHGGYPPAANSAGHFGGRRAFRGGRRFSGAPAQPAGRPLCSRRFQRRRPGRHSSLFCWRRPCR